MADRLLRSFRFRVQLRRSAAGEAGREGAVGGGLASGVGAGASFGASASAGFSAGASAGASFGGSASASAGAGASAGLAGSADFSAGVGLSASASLSAGASLDASLSLGAGAGVGGGPGGSSLGDGAFQECTGLEVEMDVQEYLEGGRNDGVVRRVGRAKYSPLVLKRGMFYPQAGTVNRDLWKWLQGIVSGERPVPRYDGIVQVMGDRDDVVATWVFDRGLPTRIRGPELNGKTGEIAMEELHIAHEGLRLEEG